MKVVLDLLHVFTNTTVLSLFHNRMWQCGYSLPRLTLNALIVSTQRVSPFYRDLHLLLNWNSCYHERNVFRFSENGALFLSKQRVSPFCQDLDLCLVGLVGNFLLVEQLLLVVVEQLLLLVVEQLLNPIPSSNYVSRKSFEEAEVTHIFFRLRLLQFSF